MEIFGDKASMRAWSRAQRAAGRTVALVPTMGNLHAGHLSLVEAARERADVVVVSIYVNPTQFGPSEDLDKYPRTFAADCALLEPLGVEAVFHPTTLYAEGGPPHETWVTVETLTQPLCGASRPTHFRGVTTVVMKFFQIVAPDVAIFGDKDFQQRLVIGRMVRDLDVPVEVVGMPIVRDADGLALSSRNSRLSPQQRTTALAIPQAVAWARAAFEAGERDAARIVAEVTARIAAGGPRVDYVELVSQATLAPLASVDQPAVLAVAAFVGDVRLIDNTTLMP